MNYKFMDRLFDKKGKKRVKKKNIAELFKLVNIIVLLEFKAYYFSI